MADLKRLIRAYLNNEWSEKDLPEIEKGKKRVASMLLGTTGYSETEAECLVTDPESDQAVQVREIARAKDNFNWIDCLDGLGELSYLNKRIAEDIPHEFSFDELEFTFEKYERWMVLNVTFDEEKHILRKKIEGGVELPVSAYEIIKKHFDGEVKFKYHFKTSMPLQRFSFDEFEKEMIESFRSNTFSDKFSTFEVKVKTDFGVASLKEHRDRETGSYLSLAFQSERYTSDLEKLLEFFDIP
ncbi:hypothetical protein MYX07_01805 [Patescibacteria group bacterium AH-259-L07]|nr:hypothetical protein [Patescibacteria group bacterium AH-259-L07]